MAIVLHSNNDLLYSSIGQKPCIDSTVQSFGINVSNYSKIAVMTAQWVAYVDVPSDI